MSCPNNQVNPGCPGITKSDTEVEGTEKIDIFSFSSQLSDVIPCYQSWLLVCPSWFDESGKRTVSFNTRTCDFETYDGGCCDLPLMVRTKYCKQSSWKFVRLEFCCNSFHSYYIFNTSIAFYKFKSGCCCCCTCSCTCSCSCC